MSLQLVLFLIGLVIVVGIARLISIRRRMGYCSVCRKAIFLKKASDPRLCEAHRVGGEHRP